MILELILALLLGIIAGTFTGLFPGIHINLIAAILIASLPKLQAIPFIALAVFIVAMSITHTFIDFIPSIFLGAPEEDTFLSVLPGHQLLKSGQGYQAAVLTLIGSLAAIPIILIFTPIFYFFLPSFYSLIASIIPFVLIFISLYMVLREEDIFPALIVFVLSGFLGFAVFNLPVKEPLMPLLTGLFGISSLIISIKSKPQIQKQKIQNLKSLLPSKKELLSSLSAAAFAAPLGSFLPGIGSGHAAVMGSEAIEQTNRKFLLLIGSINTIVMGLSFITLFAISKSRTGSAVAVQEILKPLSQNYIWIILAIIILSGIMAFILGLGISRFFANNINKINYRKLNIFIIGILLLVNLVFTNWLGILTLLTASFLGIYCILSNSKRINMMGSLIVPSIIFYLLL